MEAGTDMRILSRNRIVHLGIAIVALISLAPPAMAATALTSAAIDLQNGPAVDYSVLGKIAANGKVGVLWCGPVRFGWCLVMFHRARGWVPQTGLVALGIGDQPADATSKNGGRSDASTGTGGGADSAAADGGATLSPAVKDSGSSAGGFTGVDHIQPF